MFSLFKKSHPIKTKIVDRASEDKKRAIWTVLGGAIAVTASWLSLPGSLAYLAMVGATVATALRAGVYTDFYCSRRNEDGFGTRFTKTFGSVWKKTSLHHLSVWKIENDRYDGLLQAHFKKLDERANDIANVKRQTTLAKDIQSYTQILRLINPNGNLMPAAAGGTVLVTSVRNVVRGVLENASWRIYPTFGVGAIIGAAFSLAHLAVYTSKKVANQSSNQAFERINNLVEKTPLRHLSRFILARQIKKLDSLDISDDLTHDLVDLCLDKTLRILSEGSGRVPQGMLKTLFNVAVENRPPVKILETAIVPAANRPDGLELS